MIHFFFHLVTKYLKYGACLHMYNVFSASHLKFHVSDYIKHLKIFHAHQPNFKVICGIGGCQRNYTNLGTFQNHIYGVHSDGSCTVTEESIAVNNRVLF